MTNAPTSCMKEMERHDEHARLAIVYTNVDDYTDSWQADSYSDNHDIAIVSCACASVMRGVPTNDDAAQVLVVSRAYMPSRPRMDNFVQTETGGSRTAERR